MVKNSANETIFEREEFMKTNGKKIEVQFSETAEFKITPKDGWAQSDSECAA